jgi:hypothetical protein
MAMDGNRFDTWVKSLRFRANRRGAIRLVAGSGLAGLIDLGRADDAAACRKAGKKCEKDKQCCSKMCKGKKCRCTPLKGSCPGFGTGYRCCPQTGATVGCSFRNKPQQCPPNGFFCLLGTNAPCSEDCQCGGELICDGGSTPHCCAAPGHSCADGINDAWCCSAQCGCTAPASCTCRDVGCKSPGQTCSQTNQCCDGICQSGECCLPQGIACTGTAQCCAGLFCDAGFCDTP